MHIYVSNFQEYSYSQFFRLYFFDPFYNFLEKIITIAKDFKLKKKCFPLKLLICYNCCLNLILMKHICVFLLKIITITFQS